MHGMIAGAFTLGLLPLAGAQAAVAVAEPFADYYHQHQGIRVLGNPLRGLEQIDGNPAQYYEKGRIEDHSARERNPDWAFMYGRLTAELIAAGNTAPVGGDTSQYSYRDLTTLADWSNLKQTPYPGVDGVVANNRAQGIFVPYNAALKSGPGHFVLPQFWSYINRRELFPGGWLHDIGLPMTEPVNGWVTKFGVKREIVIQAFERAVLTFDAQNPRGWEVERANVGSDFLRAPAPATPTPTPTQAPAKNTAETAKARVTEFLHLAATDPRTAETTWYSFLSRRAQSRYVGTGRVNGSGWVAKMLGVQNTPPDCTGRNDRVCLVQIAEDAKGKPLFSEQNGQILARWTWNNGAVSNRVFKLIVELGEWHLDEVAGADIPADNRLAGEAQGSVGAFFYAWQRGQVSEGLKELTTPRRETVRNEGEIRRWLSIGATPRLVRAEIESVATTMPAKAIVKAHLVFPDGSTAERRFEVVEVASNNMAIDNVLP
jgi:hypothetical protein